MLPAFDLLTGNNAANGGDTGEHDVGKFFHKEIGEGQMQPGVKNSKASGKDCTDKKDGAEQAQHALKISHDTLPLSGGILHGQSKNRPKRNGKLTIASAMGCPFADIPD
jgi:hypothetical protein